MRRNKASVSPGMPVKIFSVLLVLLPALFLSAEAGAATLTVVGSDMGTVGGYRWLVEEDSTYHPEAGVTDPNTLSVKFHSSYMAVVGKGTEADPLPALDPAKYYFVSVLPDSGYALGGAPIAPGQAEVTVYVNPLPLPTAQITIFVFEDTAPINNAPDLPEERGLEGFSIILEDAGGRYGASAGQQMLDAFGNMLGTTYQRDINGNFLLDDMGQPIVAIMGSGIVTDADGLATIKNLAPGKYGVQAVPPVGEGWTQTSTIEGTKVIDAWVKANEPPFFAEFGPPGFHVFIGFVKEFNDAAVLNGGSTLSGQVVNLHLSRPPDYAFYNGAPFTHTTPWVGLNDLSAGVGRGVHAQRCGPDGSFSIPNVPPGTYQLVVWDDNLDVIFAFKGVTVNPDGSCNTPGGSCELGDVPVFQWFTRLENYVFSDDGGGDPAKAGNGFRDEGEMGIPEQAVNLRWRDGTIYQSMPTDGEGFVPFDEIFPFFSWLVAEVDFARFKATGVTAVVDDGGPIDFLNPWTFDGQLNPQPQVCTQFDAAAIGCTEGEPLINPNTGDNLSRTETGPVLTQAFQGFLGQTSVLQWGKTAYGPGENGGISGMVLYATTRAENDPRYAAAEPWEPGIAGVTVNLYNAAGSLINTTVTDSWDADVPTRCQGDLFEYPAGSGIFADCYDGLRNFNQVRPGLFDGGYAFDGYWFPDYNDPARIWVDGLPSGEYIVEVAPPAGYEIVKEEDRNIDFGEEYVPSLLLLPPVCVGSRTDAGLGPVPFEFTLFPLFDENGDPVTPYMAGEDTPLCNRRQVFLSVGANVAADFFLFTEVPIASHIVGFILDDIANEFDPASPQFGEKYAPPWLPVSIRDWTGREISRVLSDQYGRYNALVPSTYTTNLPAPSGMSPNMLTTCMNDPMMPNPAYDPGIPGSPQFLPDENFNPKYSTFCYTFQYMPGTTTYLDTPVVPVAAFAGPDQAPLDCEYTDGTPRIAAVNRLNGGPYLPSAPGVITIESLGTVAVPNPAYDGVVVTEKTIDRDYGFGDVPGTVTLRGTPLAVTAWDASSITAAVPSGAETGQIEVTRGDNGKATITGLTLSIGLKTGQALRRVPVGGSIQAAIDAAGTNDLILVEPGTYYEMVIMWKPVQIQGYGEGSTVINALKSPPEKLQIWRDRVRVLVEGGDVDLLPAQEAAFGGIEPGALFTEEGAGVLVLAKQNGPFRFSRPRNQGARIDGFTITGADTGGGIVANGYADYLRISNNRIINNSGFYGGGVRIGHPELAIERGNVVEIEDANNDRVVIHHNHITQNGGLGGAGGGVSVCTGSDRYRIRDNFVCGNFTLGDGGGIGHLGLSDRGSIVRNTILFNENFNQGRTVSGGGIFIGGTAPLTPGALSPGSGTVRIIGNLIQGNAAGAGDGGGIRASLVNGQEVRTNRNNQRLWYNLRILNNMIVNNVAALAGGGISLQDAIRSGIINNTITRNDSTATAGEAFSPGNPSQSNPQPAGIVARANSPELDGAIGRNVPARFRLGFSNPRLINDIIWENRSFYFFGDPDIDEPVYQLLPVVNPDGTGAVFDDLAVLGTDVPRQLNPRYCLLTDPAGYNLTNITGDPLFVAEYYNGNRDASVAFPEVTTSIQAPPAFDEGGNFIRLRFGPLTQTRVDTGELYGDYHITAGSPAVDAGLTLPANALATDYDGEPRPAGAGFDIGADELQ